MPPLGALAGCATCTPLIQQLQQMLATCGGCGVPVACPDVAAPAAL
jgi:hypothetical protein